MLNIRKVNHTRDILPGDVVPINGIIFVTSYCSAARSTNKAKIFTADYIETFTYSPPVIDVANCKLGEIYVADLNVDSNGFKQVLS